MFGSSTCWEANGVLVKVYSQLVSAQAENRTSDYSAGTRGRLWYNSSTSLLKFDDGAAVRTIVTLDNTQTLTNKTIDVGSGGTNILKSTGASAGAVPTADGAGNITFSAPASAPDESYQIANLTLTTSVAASALTIAVKTKAGSDASGGSPIFVGMRSPTTATGTYFQRSITAALSMSVSSGATLGGTNSNNEYIYVYLIDNTAGPGGLELAVSAERFDQGSIVSTTIMNSSADARSTMYSTTARANVACRLIGRILSNQGTAGTWASAITEISLTPFKDPVVSDWIPFTSGGSFLYGAGSNYSGSFTARADYRRVGSNMEALVRFPFSGGVTGNSILTIPFGLTIATNQQFVFDTATLPSVVGNGNIYDVSATANYPCQVSVESTTTVVLRYWKATGGANECTLVTATNTSPITLANGDIMVYNFSVPISEWKA